MKFKVGEDAEFESLSKQRNISCGKNR